MEGDGSIDRRLFNNIFKKEYAIVNLDTLNKFSDDTVVTPELLKSLGLVKKMKAGVKILGNGELERRLTVKAHRFSKSASEKIKKAGGEAVFL